MTQAGFDPQFAEGAEFNEWKTDAFTNQATMAGLRIPLPYNKIFVPLEVYPLKDK